MINEDYITVYWTPAAFMPSLDSWSLLYPEPKSVLNKLNIQRNKKSKVTMFNCPAYVSAMKNIFVFENSLETNIHIPLEVHHNKFEGTVLTYDNLGGLRMRVERESSFTDHTNFIYNMSWLFFADEPVVARFTAPYFPPVSPGKDVILSTGEFDIGSWYRKFDLDYHVPFTTDTLTFEEGQPLFYLELDTPKKIIFKRYILTRELDQLAVESAATPLRFGRFKPLIDRYSLFTNALMPKQILKHIKNNLID